MKYLRSFLLVLLIVLITAGASAEELRYGFTLTRVRVRNAPSTNAEILDNLLPERCVLIQSEKQQGNIHFIGITYRDAAGNLSTGWAAAGIDEKTYIDIISASQFTSEFGIPAGDLPSEAAGTSGGTYHTDIQSGSYTEASLPAQAEQSAPASQNTTSQAEQAASAAQNTAAPASSTPSVNTQADLVRAAQTRLKELGIYSADITGNIGRKTRIAIQEFQSSQGLKATGELDANTVRLLLNIETSAPVAQVQASPASTAVPAVENASQTLMIDSSGDLVYAIQSRLKELGYYSGNLTGHYGEITAAAVKQFQKNNGLTQTGTADPATISLILTGQASTNSTNTSGAYSENTSGAYSENTSVTYRKGDRSEVISEMQTCLQSLRLYSGDITGHFGSKTKDAVMSFQRKNGLTVSGDLDEKTVAAIRNAVSSSTSVAPNTSESVSSGSGIYSLDWFTAKNNGAFSSLGLVRGSYATLKDLNSGKSIRVYIQSAGYHLDVEPATSQDTSALCAAYGVSNASSITYTRRPALLTTSKGYKIACSIYGTPHGQQDITNNNFGGQFCLHFLNSRTSGSNKVDSGHQTAIQKAIQMSGGNATIIRSASDL